MSLKITYKSFIMVAAFLSVISAIPDAFQRYNLCLAADNFPGSFSELVKRVNPSIVLISVQPHKGIKQIFKPKGIGTGFIIDQEGYILTTNSVVSDALSITIILSDNNEYKARIIQQDSKTGLVLIKIEGAKDLVPLKFGDSDKIEAGDWVVTIGNPFGLNNTFTAGTVGATHRNHIGNISDKDYIQINVNLNQGYVGGPLLNLNGEVIGINSSLYSQKCGSVGIGFVIPGNVAKSLLQQRMMGKIN
jgi:serine protease Do